MYKPTIDEIENGMKTDKTPITYYAKKMYYPENGGYKNYLTYFTKNLDIKYNHKIIRIDALNKKIYFKNKSIVEYTKLISSLPLPQIILLLDNVPKDIIEKSKLLRWTSGYIISLGFKSMVIPKYLWFYIYDEDIPFARVYSPSLKSSDNCPKGCSSLQLEVYFEYGKKIINKEKLLDKCINKLIQMKVIKYKDIYIKDIRFEKFANIIFDHNIYKTRKEIIKYLKTLNIDSIGRYGEWDYFWSDQSILSAKNCRMLLWRNK